MLYDNIKNVYYQSNDLIDIAYKHDIEKWDDLPILEDDEIRLYNTNAELFDLPKINTCAINNDKIELVDSINKKKWLNSELYFDIDVLEYCLLKCESDIERNRVIYEYEQFKSHDMVTLLQYLIWLVNYMDTNDILWGVGRGSSVSSYILYLIGIHCVNPLLYNIDCKEFFKKEVNEDGVQ